MVNDFEKLYLQRLKTLQSEYTGFSEEDILDLQQAQSIACLPSVFQQFISAVGHKRGDGKRYLDQLKQYKTSLINMLYLEHADKLVLPSDAFIFYISPDVVMNAFFCRTGDCLPDPLVYYYYEANTDFLLVCPLSEWLIESALFQYKAIVSYLEDERFGNPVTWVRHIKSAELKKLRPEPQYDEANPFDDIPF